MKLAGKVAEITARDSGIGFAAARERRKTEQGSRTGVR